MVEVLKDVDLILQTHALGLIQGKLVDHLDSSLLLIGLEGGLLNLTKGSLAQNVTVKLVFFHENSHILILNDKNFVLSYNIILRSDLLFLVDWSEYLKEFEQL